MIAKKLLFYLLAALLGGCIPVMSLHPLFTEKNLVFEEKLLGIWVDDSDETTWEFSCPNETEKAYELIFSDDKGRKGSFVTYLVKLEDKLFLDVYPSKLPSKEQDWEKTEWPYNAFFFVPAHTFIIIDSIEPQLRMRWNTNNAMKELLKEDPNAVKYELVDDQSILTASTEELQAFVLKYADDSKVFPAKVVLSRKEAEAPQDPGEQDSNESSKQNDKNKSTDEKTD